MLIVPRPGEELPDEARNIRHLLLPGLVELNVSSSAVREIVRNEQDLSGFVSQAISTYIRKNRCYVAVQ